MDIEKSPIPPSNRFIKPEQGDGVASTSMATGSDGGGFSNDISRMSDLPTKNLGHRRAHSEILSLPDDISFDSDLGVVGSADGPSFSDETEEDFFAMYIDMDKFGSCATSDGSDPLGEMFAQQHPLGSTSTAPGTGYNNGNGGRGNDNGGSERPRIRHQHSQSMDGSSSIKTEFLLAGSEGGPSLSETKKAMSAAKLADLALVDPKRAKRIWANRQSAARSKERKMRYISELERKLNTLQTETTTLSAQLSMLQRDTNGLSSENNELKLRLQTMEHQCNLQDALNDALREEVQRLKVMTGQPTSSGGGSGAMYGSSSYASSSQQQQFYPNNNHSVHTLLAAQQFQQLQIQSQHHSQQQLYPQQQQQNQLQQQSPLQRQPSGDFKSKGSLPSPN
ncbi:hypothetical protein GIB67_020989 [Kingdonia uniflora]|uniref:BZIP domain-containing protein n=1 Tax=Kingdonia uniflora TaxID=39325 RepID=A0A7J7N3V0_9MAGN|nr:hypothetical protein GIB67_020989 [Kingdonia uniflora]